MNAPRLDHLVFGGPNLAQAVATFTKLTGLTPAPGGRHAEHGTANFLIGLGSGSYLEIIGPDPQAPKPAQPRWFGLDELDQPRLLTWAVRPDELIDTVDAARAAGYDPGVVRPMSRATQDGTVLSWRLTPDTVGSAGRGVVPFLIDWGNTTHPSVRDLPQARLESLSAGTADRGTRDALQTLGVLLPISEGNETGLTAVLATPRGQVVLA